MKKIFKILFVVLVAGLLLMTFVWLWHKSKPKVVDYAVVEVVRGDIETSSVATGKVSPRDEVEIKPQISGIISELRKEAGDKVRAGEVIATVKVIPEMSSLNVAESRVRQAEIAFDQVKTEYERQKVLYEKEVISLEEMDKSTAEYLRAVEELESSRDNLDIVKDGISKKSSEMSNTQIRSTIDGTILNIPVKVGNSVILSNTFNDGTTIATVANMSDMLFIGKVDETEVGRIHVGMPLTLTVGALEGTKFNAVLEYVSPQGKEESGAVMFEIKAAAEIPDSVTIRAGYSANAQMVLSEARNVLTVPEGVLSFEDDSTFVYVLTDSLSVPKTFDRRPVEIGLSNGINVEVKTGLEEGMKVRGNELPGR